MLYYQCNQVYVLVLGQGAIIGIVMLWKHPYISPSQYFSLTTKDVGRNTADKVIAVNPLYF